jgi:trehalose 6-phosphate phosphatase
MEISTEASLFNAAQNFPLFSKEIKGRTPVVFLDFDGTLAPIVNDPSKARMPLELKRILFRVAKAFRVFVISGRGLEDVRARVDIPEVICVGCHGFEMPDQYNSDFFDSIDFLQALDNVQLQLNQALYKIEGLFIERKRFALAVHFRNVSISDRTIVNQAIQTVMSSNVTLRGHYGKEVYDIKPNINWHKGKALEHLFNSEFSSSDNYPLYIGDDVTDEDAFSSVKEMSGAGIIVNGNPCNTKALFYLNDVKEVEEFLLKLLNLF